MKRRSIALRKNSGSGSCLAETRYGVPPASAMRSVFPPCATVEDGAGAFGSELDEWVLSDDPHVNEQDGAGGEVRAGVIADF